MLRTARSHTPKGCLTLRFDPRAFPREAGSLLPGLLAATRTGPSPAGDDELVVEIAIYLFIALQQSGRTPGSRRTLNGGPPAPSVAVGSVLGE